MGRRLRAGRTEASISAERVEGGILVLRGQRVMLDADLAALYGVPVKRLNEQIRRNRERFPGDFMFQLGDEEYANLRSQSATSRPWGGRTADGAPRFHAAG